MAGTAALVGLGVVAGVLDWAVGPGTAGRLAAAEAPTQTTSERPPFLSDAAQARCRLDAAAALPDNPSCPPIERSSPFAMGSGYASARRAGLHLGTSNSRVTCWWRWAASCGKSRLVPDGPRIATLVDEQVERRRAGGHRAPMLRSSASTGTTE